MFIWRLSKHFWSRYQAWNGTGSSCLTPCSEPPGLRLENPRIVWFSMGLEVENIQQKQNVQRTESTFFSKGSSHFFNPQKGFKFSPSTRQRFTLVLIHRDIIIAIPDQTCTPSGPGSCLTQRLVPKTSVEVARNPIVGNYEITFSQGKLLIPVS